MILMGGTELPYTLFVDPSTNLESQGHPEIQTSVCIDCACWEDGQFSARPEDTKNVVLLQVSQTYRLQYGPETSDKPVL